MTQQILFEFTRFIPSSIVQAQEQHLKIIKAIENREEKLAIELIICHMQVLRNEITVLKENGIL